MGPAFRGAVEEAANALGKRSEGLSNAAAEEAVTYAIIAFARLRVAVTEKVAVKRRGDGEEKIKSAYSFFDTK